LKQIEEYNQEMLKDGFWDDRRAAQRVIDAANLEKKIVEDFERLNQQAAEVSEAYEMVKDDFDEELWAMFEADFVALSKFFEDFEIRVLLSHPYDKNNAVLEIHPGAGGTESQDWGEMLLRMYQRYGELKGYKVSVLDYQEGDEAGLKSVSVLFEGPLAYGYLKSEKGVHRLVRISPFDSSGRRHTSFASVDIMPQLSDDIEITIPESDLIMETHRSSGAGGQKVNKTDSAVRLIHKPTGLVAACQTERSQHINKEKALMMLKAKLYQQMIEKQEAEIAAIKGEQKKIEWGSQIRSYVFCPYTMVKDHRTNYEEGNVDRVMDGYLDEFVYAYLKSLV
jgi:peptide chain release factor 2